MIPKNKNGGIKLNDENEITLEEANSFEAEVTEENEKEEKEAKDSA